MSPIMPPAGIALAIGFQLGPRPNAVQVEAISNPAPINLAQGDSMGTDRIQVQPSTRMSMGIANATSPSICKLRSETNAPTRPVRLTARAAPAAVFHDGSNG